MNYAYSFEGKLNRVENAGNVTKYAYDAAGNRVNSTFNAGTRSQIATASSALIQGARACHRRNASREKPAHRCPHSVRSPVHLFDSTPI